MRRLLAAALAGIVSLALFAAVFAAVSWFMRSTAFSWVSSHPRFAQIYAAATAVIWPAVVVPLLILKQRRGERAAERSETLKPAPRLWLRSFQRDT